MKQLKKIDVIVQALAIVGSVIYGALFSPYAAIIGYFIVGALQIISCVAHLFTTSTVRNNKLRKIYYCLLGVVAISAIIMAIDDDTAIAILLGWLVVTPFMAFFYLYICSKELRALKDDIIEIEEEV